METYLKETSKWGVWNVDNDSSGKITSRGEKKIVYHCVQLGQEIERDSDLQQPSFNVQMEHD